MKNKVRTRLAVLLLAAGIVVPACAGLTRPPAIGDRPPVIGAVFASPTVVYGQTWQIFIKASDPDGDLDEVLFSIQQAGRLYNPLHGGMPLPSWGQAVLDGYFWLELSPSIISGGPLDLVLSLELVDRGERRSRRVDLPLHIGTRPSSTPPAGFSDRPILAVPFYVHHASLPPRPDRVRR
ncbi:MAG: hypothetical protein KKB20_01720 [Proteobacteria bacterium]|nr:hypothetical protein [Pseudomonadota bacterium]